MIVFWLFFEENTSNYFEFGLSTGPISSTHLYLPLEWAILPIVKLVLIVPRHLEFFLRILVNQLEHITPVERLAGLFVETAKNPVVI